MNRIRNRIVLFGVAAATLTASAASLADGGLGTAHAAGAATVKLGHTGIGKILVTGSGNTIFMFTHDKKNTDTCIKISGCTGTWPVLKAHAKPTAGSGIKSSLLGTITLAHGVKQVTYASHPLYTYAFSSGPGDTSYVGTPEFGGTWYAVSAAGKTVK
jgi:predicted lipoprotein with Yx(FWY)xxD motif